MIRTGKHQAALTFIRTLQHATESYSRAKLQLHKQTGTPELIRDPTKYRLTDFASAERVDYESDGGEQMYDENSEDDDDNDVIVRVQDELPVCPIAVQLLTYALILLLLVLPR